MASVVATPLPALGIIKVIVDWTPTYTEDDPVTLYRVTPDGAAFAVIGSPTLLSGGKAIIYDTTAPFDVALTYRAEVTDPTVVRDDYDRTTANGWGVAPLGGFYTVRSGVASDFSTSTSNSRGQISNNVLTTPKTITLGTNTYSDVRAQISVRAPVSLVTGGGLIVSSLYLRYIDTLNFYQVAIGWHPDATATLRVYRRQTSPNVLTLLDSVIIGTYTLGTEYRIDALLEGSSLRVAGWTGERPDGWTMQLTDTVQAGPGYVGAGSTVSSGVSNPLPLNTYYDTLRAWALGTFSLTSAPVTLVAGRDGWVRDPQDPGRSVRLDNCASHTVSCLDADRFVFFQGLDDESYDSATGVFDVIDSENPLTVAQTRKGKATSLRLVSTTLADIPPLKRLFSDGRDLAVSLPVDYGWGIESYGTEAVTVGNVGVTRLNRRQMAKPQRVWNLPVRVVDADETYPTGWTGSNNIPVPGATFGDMKATGKTYGQLKASARTYLDWAQGVFS